MVLAKEDAIALLSILEEVEGSEGDIDGIESAELDSEQNIVGVYFKQEGTKKYRYAYKVRPEEGTGAFTPISADAISSFLEPDPAPKFDRSVFELALDLKEPESSADTYTDRAVAESKSAIASKTQAVQDLAQAIASRNSSDEARYKTMQSGLVSLYSEMPAADFGEVLAQAIAAAELAGRWEVVRESASESDFAEPTKRVLNWNGLRIGITHEIGDTRHGSEMRSPYGRLYRSYGQGHDGKAIDFYVVDEAGSLFKIRQLAEDGTVDEIKYAIAPSLQEARDAYLAHVPRDRFGGIELADPSELSAYSYEEEEDAIGGWVVTFSEDGAIEFATASGAKKARSCNPSKSLACGGSCQPLKTKSGKDTVCKNKFSPEDTAKAKKLQKALGGTNDTATTKKSATKAASTTKKGEVPVTETEAIAPTLKPQEFNPYAVKDLTMDGYLQHRKDRGFLQLQNSPNEPWNMSYEEWKENTDSPNKSKTAYSTAVISYGLNQGYVLSDAVIADIKLNKKQEAQLTQNRSNLAEVQSRYDKLQKAIEHPLMTDDEARGYSPTLDAKAAAEYVKSSFTGGLSFYHGNVKAVTDSMAGEGVQPDLNDRGMYGKGAYFATAKEVSEYFAQTSGDMQRSDTAVVEFKSKTKNPFVMDSSDIENIGQKFGQSLGTGDQSNAADANAVTEFVRAKGYDSIYLKDKGYLVTFDGRQTVAVGQEELEFQGSRHKEISNAWAGKGNDHEEGVSAASESFRSLIPAKRSESTKYEIKAKEEDDFDFDFNP